MWTLIEVDHEKLKTLEFGPPETSYIHHCKAATSAMKVLSIRQAGS